jgi:RNA polymerase sigma-70 factor, ECF subfamily
MDWGQISGGAIMETMADYDIIKEIQSGNRGAFNLIVKKYDRPLLRIVTKYVRDPELAKDILQEAFFKTYQSLSNFEFRCSFKNWIYKITLNTARNKMRSFRNTENIDDVVIAEACMIESDLLHEEVLARLKSLVESLPEKQRQTLELRVFGDLSFKEVAVEMGCPYDTAKANYRHAMLKLREWLGENQPVVMMRSSGGKVASKSPSENAPPMGRLILADAI